MSLEHPPKVVSHRKALAWANLEMGQLAHLLVALHDRRARFIKQDWIASAGGDKALHVFSDY
jgi:hypothetical protein